MNPKGRAKLYTTPSVPVAISLPQQLVDLLNELGGKRSAHIAEIIAAHFGVDVKVPVTA